MSAIDDFNALLAETEVIQEVFRSLREEPEYLLGAICGEYLKTKKAIPDHHLRLAGYISETALKALLSAGLIKRQSGGTLSVFTYEPTTKGQQQYARLRDDGFYQK